MSVILEERRAQCPVLPLEAVVDILDSKRVPINGKERATRPGDVPYYGATGQVGWIDAHIFDEELVLLGEDGAPFLDKSRPKAYLIRGRSWVNNHAHVLRAKPGLLNQFLLHQLNASNFAPFVSGTTRLKLPQGPMRQMPIQVPDELTQRLIVDHLDLQFSRLDAAVVALKRAQANLKRFRASVLKAACEGRLVPTEAELARLSPSPQAGRGPGGGVNLSAPKDHPANPSQPEQSLQPEPTRPNPSQSEPSPAFESGAALLSRILEERRKSWTGKGKYKEPVAPDTTNLPPLPDGWTWASIDQISLVALGKMLDKAKHRSGRKLPYLRNINVRWGRVDLGDLAEMFFEPDQLERYGLLPGDVLVCEGGEPGRAAVWDGRSPSMMYQKAIHRVRFYGQFSPSYLVYYLEGMARSGRLSGWFTGSTIKHFTRESFITLPVPLPPLAEQERIVSEVDRRLSVADALEATLAVNLSRATRLRQAVLSQAFSVGSVSNEAQHA